MSAEMEISKNQWTSTGGLGSYRDQITQAGRDFLRQAGPCSDRGALLKQAGALLRQAGPCSVPESNGSI